MAASWIVAERCTRHPIPTTQTFSDLARISPSNRVRATLKILSVLSSIGNIVLGTLGQLLTHITVVVTSSKKMMRQQASRYALLFALWLSCRVRAFVPVSLQSHQWVRKSQVTEEPSTESESKSIQQPDMEAYSSGYRTIFEEQQCQLCSPSQGELPSDLVGTYYKSGPAMFSAGSIVPPKTSIIQPKQPPVDDGVDPDRMVIHPFEGDGGLLALTFSEGKVVSRFRYVRTNAFTNERRRGQRLYRAMDSTRAMGGPTNDLILPLFRHHLQPGLNKNRKNTSNTRVVYWGRKLLTLWEGGLPYKMDALALSTDGRSQLGGVLKEEDPFGVKGVLDAKQDRMLFYGNRLDARASTLTLYEFNNKFRLVSKFDVNLPGMALISDFCATQKYAIFMQPPITTNGMQFMFNKEPGKVLQLDKAASVSHVLGGDVSCSVFLTFNVIIAEFASRETRFGSHQDHCRSVGWDPGRRHPVHQCVRYGRWQGGDGCYSHRHWKHSDGTNVMAMGSFH